MAGVLPPDVPPPDDVEPAYDRSNGGGRDRSYSRPRAVSNPTMTIDDVKQRLVSLSPEIAHTLPPTVSPERFMSVSLTAIQNLPKLLECHPQSLFNACLKAAVDGLLPDGREGAIIPRYNKREGHLEASWQPMLAGIQAKAKRSGNVATLSANVVYQGEVFEYELGDEERIVHKRDLSKVIKGNERAVYAIATMKDGSKEREAMTWDQVQEVRTSSSEPNGIPWTKWPDEMAKKSVIRRLSKRLPAIDDGDDDLKRSIERVDELYPFGKVEAQPAMAAIEAPVDAEPVFEIKEPPPPTKPAAKASNPAFHNAGLSPPIKPATNGHDPVTGEVFDTPSATDTTEPDPWITSTLHVLEATKSGKPWLDVLEASLRECESMTAYKAVRDAPSVMHWLEKAKPETRMKIREALFAAEKRLLAELMPFDAPDDVTQTEEAPAHE